MFWGHDVQFVIAKLQVKHDESHARQVKIEVSGLVTEIF